MFGGRNLLSSSEEQKRDHCTLRMPREERRMCEIGWKREQEGFGGKNWEFELYSKNYEKPCS